MRRLLIVCMTMVIALIAIIASVSPIVAAGSPTPTPPARPTPQGCGAFCWTLTPTAALTVNTCTGVWSISGTPGASGVGSVKQYGAGTGSIVVVRNFNTSTSLRFYAIGVIGGNASVFIVNTSIPQKYTFNGTAVACP